MPLYEYVCEQDGTVIELLRPISQADAPVKDPEGKGRSFVRRHSTFATGGATAGASMSLPMGGGGCCPCGKSAGACGMNRN
jgi:putative FmdB family regulatory protein